MIANGAMAYRHVQWGYITIPTLLLFVLVDWFSFLADDSPWIIASILAFEAVLLGTVLWFSRLEVAVDHESVTAAFGNGRPRRRFARSDIVGVRAVRNKWYYGLGVRIVDNGVMYNVWGLDAVELELESGKVFRIGTDDSQGLLASLSPLVQ